MKASRRDELLVWLIVAPLALAAITLNQSAVHWRENSADSDLFAYYGWRVANGAAPYLDVWDNKPPGIWWLNALAVETGASERVADILVGGIGLLVIAIGLLLMAREVAPRVGPIIAAVIFAAVVANPRFELGANRTETWVAAIESLAMWRLAVALRHPGARPWLIASALAGAASWFKQSGVGALAAIIVASIFQYCVPLKPRLALRWVTIVAGAAIPTAIGVALLGSRGALGEAWHAVVTFNQAYYATGSMVWTPFERIAAAWQGPLQSLHAPVAFVLLLIVMEGFSASRLYYNGSVRVTGNNAPSRSFLVVACVWLTVSSVMAAIGLGGQAYHYGAVLPALSCVLIIYFGQKLTDKGFAAARPSTAVLLTLLIAALITPANDAIGNLQRCWERKAAPWSLDWRRKPEYVAQADRIRSLTTPNATLYVWGWSPGTYRGAQRACPTRYATLEKVGQLGDRARFILDAVMRELRAAPPTLFVISYADRRGLADSPHRDFGDWLETQYEQVEPVEGMWIMRRRLSAP